MPLLEQEEGDQFTNIQRLNISGPCIVVLEDDFIELKGFLVICEIVAHHELNAIFSSNESPRKDSDEVIEEVRRISPRSAIETKIDFRHIDSFMNIHIERTLLQPIINPEITNIFRLPYTGKINKITISNNVTVIYKLHKNYYPDTYIYISNSSEFIVHSQCNIFNILSVVASNNSQFIYNTFHHKYMNILKRFYISVCGGSYINAILKAENSVTELLCNHDSLVNIRYKETIGRNIFKYFFRCDDHVSIIDTQNNKRRLVDYEQWNEIFI